MQRVFVLLILASLILPWRLVTAADKEGDNVRIVTTGEILKLDARKRTFEFRIILDAFPGGGYGGQRSRGRSGGRGPFPGRFPGGPQGRGVQYIPVMEVKVFTSERTTLKAGRNSGDFSIFRVGERVTVTGIHRGKGTDIDAIEVSKMQR